MLLELNSILETISEQEHNVVKLMFDIFPWMERLYRTHGAHLGRELIRTELCDR